METNKQITKEGVLVVRIGKDVKAIVRRDEETGHQVIYKCEEAGAEFIEEIIK